MVTNIVGTSPEMIKIYNMLGRLKQRRYNNFIWRKWNWKKFD